MEPGGLRTSEAALLKLGPQEALQKVRAEQQRASAVVVKQGLAMLAAGQGDPWSLRERIFISAVDCQDVSAQTSCLQALEKKFPGSRRVEKLKAMQMESEQKYSAAGKLYQGILKEDPADQGSMKRLICLRKAAGDLAGATKELTTYLKTFASDEHAWLELVDLYVQTGKLELAKFASEELLLMMPESFLYHLQYAEIVYSLGGKTNHTLARQYYAQSLELKPENNLRALYGLMLCLNATASNALSPEMHTFSADKITALYRKVVSEEASAKYETTISKEGAQTGQLSDQSPNLRFEASTSARNPNPYLPFLVSESLKV